MNALFLINERSGARRRFDVAEVIRRASPFEHRIVPCNRKEDVDAIVDDAERSGIDVVYAVGGDGTVHETAKRLIDRRPALGILPIGSGNGFARHLGLPMDPAASLAACRQGRIETIDTATVNDDAFIGIMGVGFDAVVAQRFASSDVRGLRTYVRVGLRTLRDYRAEDYEILANGTVFRRSAFLLAVANSSQYGNNARVAPQASVKDGRLDLVLVDPPRSIRTPILLARLFNGTFDRAHGVTTLSATELTIRRQAAGPAHLDGEPVRLEADLHVRIRPASLRVLVPDTGLHERPSR